MNILLFCQFPEGYIPEFRQRICRIAPNENLIFASDYSWSEEEYHEQLEKADVIVSYVPFKDIKYCKNVKLWIFDIAGVDGFIDSPFLPADTVVCNATGAYGNIIAEHATALMLALCRTLPQYVHNQQAHRWYRYIPDKPVEGSRVLILGAGNIGSAIARNIRPMLGSGTVTGVRRVKRDTPEYYDDMITFDELDAYLPSADFILCALPSTPLTRGLLNADRLKLMKNDAVLVNVGRGSLIPLNDLADALDEGKFYGVGLDVEEIEPIPVDHRIWDCKRILLTPHAAGNCMTQTSSTGRRLLDLIAQNIENYLNHKPLCNIVDRSTGYRTTEK